MFALTKGAKGKVSKRQTLGMMLVALACLVSKAMAEEEEPSAAGVSMSATLLGSISFIMVLYYFINYDDPDIREMTWQTVSSTISIFCAVLLWSSFNDLAEAYVIEPIFGPGDATHGALLVDILHMLLWFVIMQFSLAWLSGAAGTKLGPFPGKIRGGGWFSKLSEEGKEELKEEMEINMACYSVLCAHVTGFASINAFGTIQMVFFSGSALVSMLTPVCALVFMLGLQRVTDACREKHMQASQALLTTRLTDFASGGEEVTDEFADLWDDETEEAENDVMGLALSFTMVSALRFAISGCLPNQEGKEEECPAGFPEEFLYHHSYAQKGIMIAMGFAFGGIIFVMRSHWPEWLEGAEIKKMAGEGASKDKIRKMKLLSRLAEGIYVAICMCFSWSFFFGIQMIMAGSSSFFQGEPELLSVVLALVVSALCMGMILPLDKVADADWTDEHADMAIRSIMSAMGLLIGFSWEQCFDASVGAIAATTADSSIKIVNPHTAKLALTIFCAGLLVPAWKWYMLPFIVSKGWEAEYPLQAATKLAKKMIKDQEAPEAGKKPETPESAAKKLARIEELGEAIEAAGKKHKGLATAAPVVKDPAESKTPYVALQGDENVDSLKAQVATLTSELNKSRSTALRGQQMHDATMANMLASMKQMSDAVSRIEQR